ncbi:hypothetical protein ADUPG1_010155 [Aduncisulcus paluster]|uniref:Uncharacterized protein n=1 Tax=Aduncisulcus paluster TaxID=2918883 RepID=A0ABQ5KY31_9EUKA|nr:hypothetical protein ADUPG1_010155 [Aduncisulcus paluster]
MFSKLKEALQEKDLTTSTYGRGNIIPGTESLIQSQERKLKEEQKRPPISSQIPKRPNEPLHERKHLETPTSLQHIAIDIPSSEVSSSSKEEMLPSEDISMLIEGYKETISTLHASLAKSEKEVKEWRLDALSNAAAKRMLKKAEEKARVSEERGRMSMEDKFGYERQIFQIIEGKKQQAEEISALRRGCQRLTDLVSQSLAYVEMIDISVCRNLTVGLLKSLYNERKTRWFASKEWSEDVFPAVRAVAEVFKFSDKDKFYCGIPKDKDHKDTSPTDKRSSSSVGMSDDSEKSDGNGKKKLSEMFLEYIDKEG